MKLTVFALLLTAHLSAQAGILGSSIFLEPYIGYKSENTKLVDLSNNQTRIKAVAPALGLNFGYRSQIGVDLNLAAEYVSGEAEISNTTQNNKFNKTSTSVQLGVNSLGAVKMYLGFAVSNDFQVEETSEVNSFKLSGPCYHVGLVFKVLQKLNIGVQYNVNQYNVISGRDFSSGDKIETYYSRIDTQDYLISISTTL